MARPRKIKIPEGLVCNECESDDLIGAGKDWKLNPYWKLNLDGEEPRRIKVQKYRCKSCGKIMLDGEVKNIGGSQ